MGHVYFAIPVSPYRSDEQWSRVNELLAFTLGSLQQQSSTAFTAMICGHERPDCLSGLDPATFQFLEADFAKPDTIEEGRRDKGRKRRRIAMAVREHGGGYFMYLDADDTMHRNLVQAIVTGDNRIGYTITDGYALDFANCRIAPIPGAWRKPFNGVCGSSGAVFFTPDDLPTESDTSKSSPDLLYFRVRNHTVFHKFEEIGGQELEAITFPAGMYTLNNQVNLSNVMVRTEERNQQLIDGIAKLAISGDALDQVIRDFGLQSLFDR